MQTVREAMSNDIHSVPSDATVLDAARAMARGDIGALPVCDEQQHLQGIITDRDITVRVVADALDPARTLVRDVVDREVVTVGADDEIETAIAMMKRHAVRRVPVMDGSRVIGMLSQADVAGHAEAEDVGDMVRTISDAPGNTGDGP